MKRIIIASTICLLLFAQSISAETVYLENQEDTPLFFTIDPNFRATAEKAPEELPKLAKAGKLFHLFPESIIELPAIEPGEHRIVGYYAPKDSKRYPILVRNVVVEKKKERYTLSYGDVLQKNDALVTVKAEHIVKPKQMLKIDDDYKDWIIVPSVATFSRTYQPPRVYIENKAGLTARPLSQARFWGKGGTNLESVKALMDDTGLYLYISTYSRIEDGLSFFMYLYPDGKDSKQNPYTLEIPINDDHVVALWTENASVPKLIGGYTDNTYFLEAKVSLSHLPEAIKTASSLEADITTCFFGETRYEEFLFTSLSSTDIPRFSQVSENKQEN